LYGGLQRRVEPLAGPAEVPIRLLQSRPVIFQPLLGQSLRNQAQTSLLLVEVLVPPSAKSAKSANYRLAAGNLSQRSAKIPLCGIFKFCEMPGSWRIGGIAQP
jgi:hypothetical protein